jgi:hypothetical protein
MKVDQRAYLLLCLILLVSSRISLSQSIDVTLRPIVSIDLEKDNAYEKLTASDRFIVWFEHYTFSFYAYDLTTRSQKQISINKGRGPGEITWLNSVTILGNELVVFDLGSMKLVYFVLVSGVYKREHTSNMMMQTVVSDGENLYGSALSPNGFFFHYEPKSSAFRPLQNSKLPFLNQFNMADPSYNPFKIQGTYTACDGCLILNTFYEPRMYIYRLGSQKLESFKYENIPDVDFESGRQGNTLGAPKPLQMYIDRISAIDAQNVAVLARGKSEVRDYSSRTVHIFNIDSKKHVGRVSFDYDVNDMALTGKYMTTLSKEKWRIDVYELIKQ